jgi:hypothetical protein
MSVSSKPLQLFQAFGIFGMDLRIWISLGGVDLRVAKGNSRLEAKILEFWHQPRRNPSIAEPVREPVPALSSQTAGTGSRMHSHCTEPVGTAPVVSCFPAPLGAGTGRQ